MGQSRAGPGRARPGKAGGSIHRWSWRKTESETAAPNVMAWHSSDSDLFSKRFQFKFEWP